MYKYSCKTLYFKRLQIFACLALLNITVKIGFWKTVQTWDNKKPTLLAKAVYTQELPCASRQSEIPILFSHSWDQTVPTWQAVVRNPVFTFLKAARKLCSGAKAGNGCDSAGKPERGQRLSGLLQFLNDLASCSCNIIFNRLSLLKMMTSVCTHGAEENSTCCLDLTQYVYIAVQTSMESFSSCCLVHYISCFLYASPCHPPKKKASPNYSYTVKSCH